MSRLLWVLTVATTLAAGCTPRANVEQERNALLQRDREWSQTTTDPDKFAAYFGSDGAMYAPGMPLMTGQDAIKKVYAGMSSSPGFTLRWSPNQADIGAAGDLGYTTGTYELAMGGGNEKGKYITVWKKQSDGSWKVARDIFNADAMPRQEPSQQVMAAGAELKWGDAPPVLPKGAKAAIVSGDPGKAGPYVIRLQMPAGYKIGPHWHPTDENVTVLTGTFALGMGDKFDQPSMKDLPASGFGILPAEMHHFAMAKTAATVQVHGVGPFTITYVNPADDPSKQTK